MGKKKKQKSTERHAYGITVLKSADARVRKLKSQHEPNIHGNKVWNSSWCIMDFIQQQGFANPAILAGSWVRWWSSAMGDDGESD